MSSASLIESYPFNLLHEKVAEDDFFQDKTHDHVASALARLIRDETTGGITIGLEGKWGSGKSTVVHLLRKKLDTDANKKTLFFHFDAWAHEGDPLRRIFLESLIKSTGYASEPTLKDIQERVSTRKRTVDVKIRRGTSKLGKRLALSALFVPGGAAVLSNINYSELTFGGGSLDWWFVMGVTASVMPLLVCAHWFIWGEKDKDEKRDWSVLETNSDETHTQDVTEGPERTSVEFEAYFQQILEYLVETQKHQRIIIVIDNLDRIDPRSALNIWSTLQTYLQHRNGGKKDHSWAKKLWIVVPYDRKGLARLWENSSPTSPDDSQTLDGYSDRGATPDSFFDKCFQVRVEVPAPIFSGWVEFLKKQVDVGLSAWPEESRAIIAKSYQQFHSNLSICPTPREITNFVNQIGVCGLRWGEKVSPQAMALYTLHHKKDTEEKLRARLISKDFKILDIGDMSQEYIADEMAGLLFGVDKERGRELLLYPEIKTALDNGKGDDLVALARQHGEGFSVVWQVVQTALPPPGSIAISYLVTATKCIETALATDGVIAKAWAMPIISIWAKIPTNNVELSAADGVVSALKIAPNNPAILANTQHILQRWLREDFFPSGKNPGKISNKTVDAILFIVIKLSENGRRPTKNPYPGMSSEQWAAWSWIVSSKEKRDQEILDIVIVSDDVITELAGSIQDNQPISIETLTAITYAMDISPWAQSWKLLIDQCDLYIRSHHANSNKTFSEEVVDILIMGYAKFPLARPIITSMAENWTIFNHVIRLPESPDAIARWSILAALGLGEHLHDLYVQNRASLTGAQRIRDWWSDSSNQDMAHTALTIYIKHRLFDQFWIVASDTRNALAKTMLDLALEKPEFEPIFASQESLRRIEKISFMRLPENTFDLARHIASKAIALDVLNSQMKAEIGADPLKHAYLLRVLSTTNNESIFDFMEVTFNSIETSVWEKAFEENSHLLVAVTQTYSQGKKNTLDDRYQDALIDWIKDALANKKLMTDWQKENFKELTTLAHRPVLLQEDVTNAIQDSTELWADAETFKKIAALSSATQFQSSPDRTLRQLNRWLQNDQWVPLEWIGNLDISISASGEIKSSITSHLKKNRVEHPTRLSVITNLAKLLGIILDTPDSTKADNEKSL